MADIMTHALQQPPIRSVTQCIMFKTITLMHRLDPLPISVVPDWYHSHPNVTTNSDYVRHRQQRLWSNGQ